MDKKYDACLSFSGEQREYVEEVFQILTSMGFKVFYDKNEEAELWGGDLVENFVEIYFEQSKYCIMFISKEYAESKWTRVEKRSSMARAINTNNPYILPVRFDNTQLPGILDTIHYIDANTTSPKELAELFAKKFQKNQSIHYTLSSIKSKIENMCIIHETKKQLQIISNEEIVCILTLNDKENLINVYDIDFFNKDKIQYQVTLEQLIHDIETKYEVSKCVK